MCVFSAVVCPVRITEIIIINDDAVETPQFGVIIIFYKQHLKRLRGKMNDSHCDNAIYLDIEEALALFYRCKQIQNNKSK